SYDVYSLLYIYLFFFFSSRRRHTRSDRDWSSDVCSSDLSAFLTVDRGRVVAQTTPAPVVAVPAPPACAPAPAVSVKRREILLAHPAVRAWQQLDPQRVVPDRITPAKFKPNKPRPNLTVYRLEGVGIDGAAVIA